jgi:hypothetical protein
MENKLKDLIIERYGSVNNFVEKEDIALSRSQIYNILNQTRSNVTLASIQEFARVLKMTEQNIIDLLIGYMFGNSEVN